MPERCGRESAVRPIFRVRVVRGLLDLAMIFAGHLAEESGSCASKKSSRFGCARETGGNGCFRTDPAGGSPLGSLIEQDALAFNCLRPASRAGLAPSSYQRNMPENMGP